MLCAGSVWAGGCGLCRWGLWLSVLCARIAAALAAQRARACPEVIDYFGVDFSEAMIKFYMEPMKMALYDYYVS